MTLWQRLCYLFSLSFFCRVLILKFKFACSLLTLLMLHILLFQVFWAFSIYLEAVAILPQLVLLQRSGNVDNLTGQYVFFLGYASSPVNLATSWKDIICIVFWKLEQFYVDLGISIFLSEFDYQSELTLDNLLFFIFISSYKFVRRTAQLSAARKD